MKKRQKVMCFVLAGLFLVFAVFSGCSSKSLTRTKAARLIAKAKGFPQHVYFTIPTGRVRTGFVVGFIDQPSRMDYLQAWAALERMGYITVKILEPKGAQNGNLVEPYITLVYISMTPKGKKAFKKIKKRLWGIELCRAVLKGVTGILRENNYTALVKYEWAFEGIHPITKVVLRVSPLRGISSSDLKAIHKGEVLMKKYDDGWRVVENE